MTNADSLPKSVDSAVKAVVNDIDLFVARRQAYLDALPIAAAVLSVERDTMILEASNAAYGEIGLRTPGRGPLIEREEIARRLRESRAQGYRGDTFGWRDGNPADARHYSVTISPIGGSLSGKRMLLITMIDRTLEVRNERSLRSEMLSDSLTGLPNRMGFIDRAEQRFQSGGRSNQAIIVIDLARFARVNECIGPVGGDELIITVARRLLSTIRGYDTLGRTGANEFAMIVRFDKSPDEVHKVVDRIERVLAGPCRLSDFEIKIDCAIGCAVGSDDIADAEQLLRNAQVALKSAKTSGGLEFYQPSTLAVARRRFTVETELRRAIEQDRLSLAFQPLIAFDTGKVVGFESLARWDHPTLGAVPPNEFVTVAEESGLIVPLGRWALDRALATLADWDAQLGTPLPIYLSVNLSAIQMARDDVASAVGASLAFRKIAGGRLAVELTESAIVADPDRAWRTLEALKACDAMVAMDDFGTGFSNLASLQRLPIDTLKIDRSFVSDLIGDTDKIAIVGAIQSLAQALGMTTTAEGIETAEQAALLSQIGCTVGQGYYYARPLSADDALAFARKSLSL